MTPKQHYTFKVVNIRDLDTAKGITYYSTTEKYIRIEVSKGTNKKESDDYIISVLYYQSYSGQGHLIRFVC